MATVLTLTDNEWCRQWRTFNMSLHCVKILPADTLMPLSPFSACSSFFPFPLANLFLLFASPDIVVRSPAPAPHWLYSPRSCGGTNLQILSAQDVIPSCQQITISPPVVTAVAPAPCRVPTQHCVLTVPNLFRASVPTWHQPPAASSTAHHTTCSAQQQPLPPSHPSPAHAAQLPRQVSSWETH